MPGQRLAAAYALFGLALLAPSAKALAPGALAEYARDAGQPTQSYLPAETGRNSEWPLGELAELAPAAREAKLKELAARIFAAHGEAADASKQARLSAVLGQLLRRPPPGSEARSLRLVISPDKELWLGYTTGGRPQFQRAGYNLATLPAVRPVPSFVSGSRSRPNRKSRGEEASEAKGKAKAGGGKGGGGKGGGKGGSGGGGRSGGPKGGGTGKSPSEPSARGRKSGHGLSPSRVEEGAGHSASGHAGAGSAGSAPRGSGPASPGPQRAAAAAIAGAKPKGAASKKGASGQKKGAAGKGTPSDQNVAKPASKSAPAAKKDGGSDAGPRANGGGFFGMPPLPPFHPSRLKAVHPPAPAPAQAKAGQRKRTARKRVRAPRIQKLVSSGLGLPSPVSR